MTRTGPIRMGEMDRDVISSATHYTSAITGTPSQITQHERCLYCGKTYAVLTEDNTVGLFFSAHTECIWQCRHGYRAGGKTWGNSQEPTTHLSDQLMRYGRVAGDEFY